MYRIAQATPGATGPDGEPAPAPPKLAGLSADEQAVLDLLDPNEPLHLDALADRVPFGIARLQAALLGLAWDDALGATGYLVFGEAASDATFATVLATSASGTAGTSFALDIEAQFFLVAARNACGSGPVH